MAQLPDPQYVRGIVDMGSNGIRLSLSSLAPPLTRTLPTLYQSRIPISLYDAQYPPGATTRQPIPSSTTAVIVKQLLRFKKTCNSFGCKDEHVTILATEATRTAVNATEYIAELERATGWKVSLLAKEEEGRVGAYGVASSLGRVEGLVMDLGGGSTQLSYLTRSADGPIQLPKQGGVSLPYGAAALSRRLREAQASPSAVAALEAEIKHNLTQAVAGLSLPASLQTTDSLPLYLSGGGFRGWGYALMSSHAIQPYPIPIINGFSVSRSAFLDTAAVQDLVTSASLPSPTNPDPPGLFRVSARRAAQVPAVALLIAALAQTLPAIRTAHFCQGGVREGHLFRSLEMQIQRLSPLETATGVFAQGGGQAAGPLATTLGAALPVPIHGRSLARKEVLLAFANTLYLHSGLVKDVRAAAALRFSTTGDLAGTHGLSHEERALLGLLLCERWGGRADLPDAEAGFYDRLSGLVGDEDRWWTRYLGRVGALCGAVWPAGLKEGGGATVRLEGSFGQFKKGRGVVLTVSLASDEGEDAGQWEDVFRDELEDLTKVGKRKNWIGGKEGVGYKVEVEVKKRP